MNLMDNSNNYAEIINNLQQIQDNETHNQNELISEINRIKTINYRVAQKFEKISMILKEQQ